MGDVHILGQGASYLYPAQMYRSLIDLHAYRHGFTGSAEGIYAVLEGPCRPLCYGCVQVSLVRAVVDVQIRIIPAEKSRERRRERRMRQPPNWLPSRFCASPRFTLRRHARAEGQHGRGSHLVCDVHEHRFIYRQTRSARSRSQ